MKSTAANLGAVALKTTVLIASVVFVLLISISGAVFAVLRPGDAGEAVRELQTTLAALGYYSGTVDGHFGPGTKQAVMAFQKSEGLLVDGLVGGGTQKRLAAKAGVRSVSEYTVRAGDTIWSIARSTGARPADLIRLNELRDASRLQIGQRLKVPQEILSARRAIVKRPSDGAPQPIVTGGLAELLPWTDASKVFPNGARARVTDVETGLSFWVHRIQGTYHADSEPVSAADTEVVRRVYGGRWSWNRRAIWVEVNGRVLAASMNGYPHGRKGIGDNRYPGHFCIHFYGSRTHGSGRLDPQHQAAVLRAAKAGQALAVERATDTSERDQPTVSGGVTRVE